MTEEKPLASPSIDIEYKSKYHRKKPIRDFSPDQTMYELVRNINANNMNYFYSGYLGQNTTFRQLFSDTDRLAAAFSATGVKKNQIVGVCLLTTPEVCPILLSLNKIGAVSYWMDASLKPADMQKKISELGIEVLVIFEPLLPAFIQLAEKMFFKRIIVVKANPLLGIPDILPSLSYNIFVEYNSFIQEAPDSYISPVTYEKGRTTVIVQSSGSTGKPKSISHTDYNFNSAVLKMAYADFPFYEKKRAMVCAPPWVVYGLVNSIYSGLVLGIQTIFTTQPCEDMIYKHLGQFDFVYGVPIYLRFLYSSILELQECSDENAKQELKRIWDCLKQVDAFVSGGDKISDEELISWQLTFDKVIVNGYGNNEVTGAAIVSPRFANRPGSIGIPLHGVNVKTFDVETGKMLPDGQTGELCINSDALFSEYYHDPVTTKTIKQIHDGIEWIHTGDLATVDSDGFVYLLGRTRRLIIDKLGYKISPENSENLIMGNENVVECVVVGVEIAENETVPAAFIEFFPEHKNEKSLIKQIELLCRERLKEYERPKYYFEIEHIPHKENGGKLDFLALEKLAADYVAHLKQTSS